MQKQDFSSLATPEVMNLGQGSWYHDEHDGRKYNVYIPANYQVGTAVPLIMMLHGCFEFPDGFAYLSHMSVLADQHQFLIVYPHGFAPKLLDIGVCWFWFLAGNQRRGHGEPASLTGIIQHMLKNTSRWTIDQKRIYVAGASAGACVAVNLGVTYPELFAAIGVHSGTEYQAFSLDLPLFKPATIGETVSAQAAAETLRNQQVLVCEGLRSLLPAGPDPIKQGEKAFQVMGSLARVVPTIVFHGTADPIADPIGGEQVVRQWLRTNQLASHGTFTASFEHPSRITLSPAGPQGERAYTVLTWQDAHGSDVVAYWKVDGMGHDWSGGSFPSLYADPKGPDASQAIYEFFMAHPFS